MVVYEPPYCAICGGPFDNVYFLDFWRLSEDDEYQKDAAYDSQLLPATQVKWISEFRIIAKVDYNGVFSARSQITDKNIYVSATGTWQYDKYWFHNAPARTDASAGAGTGGDFRTFYKYLTIHDACMRLLEIFTQDKSRSSFSHAIVSLSAYMDACVARQVEARDLDLGLGAGGRRSLPWYRASFQNVEHSYLYFGARRFWADPWDCEAGSEYLCADPLDTSGIEPFIATCLALPQRHQAHQPSPPLEGDGRSSQNIFARLPRELLDLIASHLSLGDVLRLHSSSRNLLNVIDSTFWRSQTTNSHGDWFWELHNYRHYTSDNWKALLQTLQISRSQLWQEAEPYWLKKAAKKNSQSTSAGKRVTSRSLALLPIGLRNRQRIWMCLTYMGVKADWEIKANADGQKRRHADCRSVRSDIASESLIDLNDFWSSLSEDD